MAKDDFFVIAYKILAYLYECLKAGESPRLDEISDERLGIAEKYWYSIITMLYNEGYLSGVKEVHIPWQKGTTLYRACDPEITIKGIEFLQNNSSMAKARETLKDLKAMIPGI